MFDEPTDEIILYVPDYSCCHSLVLLPPFGGGGPELHTLFKVFGYTTALYYGIMMFSILFSSFLIPNILLTFLTVAEH